MGRAEDPQDSLPVGRVRRAHDAPRWKLPKTSRLLQDLEIVYITTTLDVTNLCTPSVSI